MPRVSFFRWTTSLLVLVLTASAAAGAAGDRDPGFHEDGIVTLGIGSSHDEAHDVVVQPDGKILIVGETHNGLNEDIALVRYKQNGNLDTSFDSDGIQTTTAQRNANHDFARTVALQPDGKILVAGATTYANDDFTIARFHSDGALDTDFGVAGFRDVDFGSVDVAEGVAIQDDGKIVVVGRAYTGTDYDVAVVRLNGNGSFDETFSDDGKVMTRFGSGADFASDVAIQPNDKIVLAGEASNGSNADVALARYNSDGALDPTFDGDGKVMTPIGGGFDIAYALSLRRDKKIVIAGVSYNGSNYDLLLARYNPDGSLDTSFSFDGKLTADVGKDDYFQDLAVQGDGRFVVAGSHVDPVTEKSDMVVARFRRNGSFDPSFGENSLAITSFGDYDRTLGVALQGGGKILSAGIADGPTDDIAVIRHLGRTSRGTTLTSSVTEPESGRSFTLRGKVSSDDRLCIRKARVEIRRDVFGGAKSFAEIATVKADRKGRFALRLEASRSARYKAKVLPTPSCGTASATITVKVTRS